MLTLEIRAWKNGLFGCHVYVVRVLEDGKLFALMPRGHGHLERGLAAALDYLVSCGKVPASVREYSDPFRACYQHNIEVNKVRVYKRQHVDYCYEAASC